MESLRATSLPVEAMDGACGNGHSGNGLPFFPQPGVTNQNHFGTLDDVARANSLAINSGPIPAGSPRVSATAGFCETLSCVSAVGMTSPSSVIFTAPEVKAYDVSLIEYH